MATAIIVLCVIASKDDDDDDENYHAEVNCPAEHFSDGTLLVDANACEFKV